MYRIGIDFDNTIACYDRVFPFAARELNLLEGTPVSSKTVVKKTLLSSVGGDLDWQRLQGKVYGKYMHLAEIYPGFFEFLYLSKLRGCSIVIVSHKSEFGHFDEEQISLREQALSWMIANRFFENEDFSLSEGGVFFESSREEKIRRIISLDCTHFIDDLFEIFDDPLFPGNVQKIWFQPNLNEIRETSLKKTSTWREICSQVYGSWSEEEICSAAQSLFPDLGIVKAQIQKGRGNSRIYKLYSAEIYYALKIYPDRQLDPRPRLKTEFSACRFLHGRGYQVTQAVAYNESLDWGVYEWIPGSPIERQDEFFLNQSAAFITCLLKESILLTDDNQFQFASEACLSGAEIVRQINKRFQRLMNVKSDDLVKFLKNEFQPCVTAVIEQVKQECGSLFDQELSRELQILSPSDFGSHNAIRNEDGRVTFIDFEYFGWDDPVKLTADFFWHPGMNLSNNLRLQWINRACEIFSADSLFYQRLKAYLPLYGLRWCLILLNEFIPPAQARRVSANANNLTAAVVKRQQLSKAIKMLKEVRSVYEQNICFKGNKL